MKIRRRNPADGKHGLPCSECGRAWTVHATVGQQLVLLCDKHAAALSVGVEEAVADKLDERVDLHPGHPICPVCSKRLEPRERVTMVAAGAGKWTCDHTASWAEPVTMGQPLLVPRGDAATLAHDRQLEGQLEAVGEVDEDDPMGMLEDNHGDR